MLGYKKLLICYSTFSRHQPNQPSIEFGLSLFLQPTKFIAKFFHKNKVQKKKMQRKRLKHAIRAREENRSENDFGVAIFLESKPSQNQAQTFQISYW